MILLSNIYDFIINHFDAEPIVNTITCDNNDEIASNKQTIYPLVNIELLSAPIDLESNLLAFQFNISAMSERDFDKKTKSTKLIGKDNKIDNLNEMYYLLRKFIDKTARSNNINGIDLSEADEIVLIDGATSTVLDGFKCDITLTIPNTIAIC
jgi:hypothetical protein